MDRLNRRASASADRHRTFARFVTVTGWAANSIPPFRALGLCFLAYMLASAFGRWMMVIPDIPITVWPPNGVILAMLLTQPRQSWPWWLAVGAAGELTGNVIWFHNPVFWALGYVMANLVAVTTAAALLSRRFDGPIRRFSSLHQVLAFLAIGVLGAPVISATLGASIGTLAGKNPFLTTWPVWWLGDATGILIATPLVISSINTWVERIRPSGAQVLEGVVIALVIAGLVAWEMVTGAAYSFLLTVPILWTALRFEFRGATLAALGLALAIGVYAQSIAFAEVSSAEVARLHTRLQALLLVAATIGLIVAAIIRQHRVALCELALANDELEARVRERTRAIEAAEQRFKATFENAGVGMSIVSGGGFLMRVNDSLAKMLGYAVDELENQPLDRFTHPEDRASGEEALNRLRAGLAEEYDLEKRYIRKDGEHVWGHTTVSCVRHPDGQIAYLIKIIQDITERKSAEETRQILTREVNHRSKNLLAIVQVIARQTAGQSPKDFAKSLGRRLQALASNHDLLVNSAWRPVGLAELVHSQLDPLGAVEDRVELSGPDVKVSPSAAQALSMALHELATNAVKYGSLSNETGQVKITWRIDEDDFYMAWREIGGPPVDPPTSKGFGTTVLDALTASAMSGVVDMDYAPDGLVWTLRCPAAAVHHTAVGAP